MKRKLITYLLSLLMVFTINSCGVYDYATTQDDIYVESEVDIVRSNVSFDVIIQYGTPYYHNGSILYYVYNDLYYYPFYYNNYWYVRAYRRPFIHLDRRPYFRPHRYDYRFKPGHYRGFDRPNVYYYRNRPSIRRQDVMPRRSYPNRITRPSQSNINRNRITRPSQGNITPNRRIDLHQQNREKFGNRR